MAVKDTVNGLSVVTLSVTGPASYATGGFAVDASATHSYLGFILPTVTAIDSIAAFEYEVSLNKDTSGNEALGKAVIKLVRHQYDKPTSGGATSAPSGVTVQAALTANTAATHTHDFTHSHGTVTSSTEAQAGSGSTAATTPSALGHTHNFTIGAATVTTTPAGGSHSHNRPFEYDHRHDLTTATTDIAVSEIAAATDLSGVTFKVLCFGFGAT